MTVELLLYMVASTCAGKHHESVNRFRFKHYYSHQLLKGSALASKTPPTASVNGVSRLHGNELLYASTRQCNDMHLVSA